MYLRGRIVRNSHDVAAITGTVAIIIDIRLAWGDNFAIAYGDNSAADVLAGGVPKVVGSDLASLWQSYPKIPVAHEYHNYTDT